VNLTADAAGVKHIVLDNVRGNLSLKGDSGTQIRVTGHTSIRAISHGEADRADRQSPVRIEREGDTAFIRGDAAGVQAAAQVSGELDVAIPRGVSLESRTRTGDLTI